MGKEPPPNPDEQTQQVEFSRSETDLLTVTPHAVLGEIDFKPGDTDHGPVGVRRGATEHRIDPSNKLLGPERLRDVIIRAGSQRPERPRVRDPRASLEDPAMAQ